MNTRLDYSETFSNKELPEEQKQVIRQVFEPVFQEICRLADEGARLIILEYKNGITEIEKIYSQIFQNTPVLLKDVSWLN